MLRSWTQWRQKPYEHLLAHRDLESLPAQARGKAARQPSSFSRESEDRRRVIRNISRHQEERLTTCCKNRTCVVPGSGRPSPELSDAQGFAGAQAPHRGAGRPFPGVLLDWYENHLVIDPWSAKWTQCWDSLAIAVAILLAFTAPYEAGFGPVSPGFELFDYVFLIVLVVDMVLQFFIALPDGDRPSCVIKSPGLIIGQYVKGWFLMDVATLLPYIAKAVLHLGFRSHGYWTRRILSHLGLLRLLRLPRLSARLSILRGLQIYFGFSFAALEVARYFLLAALACHWSACAWGGVGLSGLEEERTWLHKMARDKGVPLSLFRESHSQAYAVSLYWAIMTLTSVGYGDVVPQNAQEYSVACLAMGLSAALWAFIIGQVCRIAANFDPQGTRFMRTMDDLNSLMRSRAMPRDVRMRMRTYLYEARALSRHRTQNAVLEQLSPMLQGQLAMQLYQAWLEKVWYMRDVNGQALVNIARRLLSDFFAPGEEVTSARTLFICRRGICIRRSRMLFKGDTWGEDMVLSNQVLRDEAPVKAISFLEVVVLHNIDLHQAVRGFPGVISQIRKAKVKIAVMRGIVLVARAIKDLMLSQGWSRDEFAKQVDETDFVQAVLAGKSVQAALAGKSDTPSRITNHERMRSGSGASTLWLLPGAPTDGTECEQTAHLQSISLALANLTMKVDGLCTEKRARRT